MPVQTNYNTPYTSGVGSSGPGTAARTSAAAGTGPAARSGSTAGSDPKTTDPKATDSDTKNTDATGNVIDAVFGDGEDKKVSMEDFLTLMVAQLKNQDFMNPVDDTQYVTQLAQISTMQQMEEMAYNAKSSYVASLVGKNVSAAKFTVSGDLKKADGVVEKISLLDGKFVIYVKGEAFSMDEIMEIKDKPTAEVPEDDDKTPPGDSTPPDDSTPPGDKT